MSLIDYANEEKMKHDLLNIVRILLKGRIDVDVEKWDYIVDKMMEEWKDVDVSTEKLKEDNNWKVLSKIADEMHIDPDDLLVRIKLMYFVAKSEIQGIQILEMQRLLDK
jgi:hypothetical protein